MRDASAATLALPRPRLHSAIRTKEPLRVRSVRPSVLDLRFCGDAWIEVDQDGDLAVYLGEYHLVTVAGLSIDLPALNTILDRVRHRRPRRRPPGSR